MSLADDDDERKGGAGRRSTADSDGSARDGRGGRSRLGDSAERQGPEGHARDQARLRSLAHPVRVRILSLLTGAQLTAADVARELGLTHANASYHLRNLLNSGQIEVAGEEHIRGGVAKRYRYEVDKHPREFPRHREGRPGTSDHRLLLETFAGELRRRASGYISAEDNLVADADLWVDPAVWHDVHARIAAAVADLHRAAQPPRTPGSVHTSTTVALFRMTER